MNLALWLRFAARDLRSGLQGFWIFLTCLALGTAAIAMIGSLSASIERGLNEQGQPLLGGDVAFSLIHREATGKELAFIAKNGTVSKIAAMRAMAVAPETTTHNSWGIAGNDFAVAYFCNSITTLGQRTVMGDEQK